jgi:AraC-like DNA-binding protein
MAMNMRKEDLQKLHTAKFILDNEYRYHYTIDQLAEKVGTNAFKLKVGFKQLFNTTPFEYLTTIRIEKAKHLLETTEYPVKRIAREIGFPQATNFIRRFKVITGISPNEWRKNRAMSA